jgi:mono/diheme cytochrome c family protein
MHIVGVAVGQIAKGHCMSKRLLSFGAVLLALGWACSGMAAAPVVPGFERFGREASDPAAAIESGLLLLGELGCVNCHAAGTDQATHLMPKQGPLLDKVGERLRHEWLVAYLKTPQTVKPGTTMPHALAGLPDAERDRTATALAHFLAATGAFDDGALHEAAKANAAEGLKVYERAGCAVCHGSRTNDAKLLPDQMPLVDLDKKWAPRALDEFLKDPLQSRPSSRMPALPLKDQDRRHVVASLLGTSPSPAATFKADPTLVEEGQTAFAAVGCANCHELKGSDGKRIESAAKPKPLAELMTLDSGCLATAARKGSPHYPLDDTQRAAVAAAIRWLASPEAESVPAREQTIDRMLTSLNCYACHNRHGRGGTIPAVAITDDDGEPVLKDVARDALFTSAVQELGDEGRLPPTLTGVGDKLTGGFLREVLVEGGKDRGAYMHTLMPKWQTNVAEPLAKLLAEDAKTPVPVPALAGHAAVEIEEQGRGLVGSKALGCIKCHSFGGDKGQSLGVIDLVRMPKRLRHEWFLAYVANPQQFRPGTRMPAAWPEGKTFYPDLLDGTAAGQIEGVWRYLAGAKPRPPIGASAHPIELVPTDQTIVYRNFIEGAGPRAIAVGFPDKVHVAWDADQMRLALVWRGAFIDAGKHWTGRGQGFQSPLGDGVFAPDAAPSIAVLGSPESSWPVAAQRGQPAGGQGDGVRFRGYSLDAQGRPTFNWSNGGMRISETIEPVVEGGKTMVRRTIRLAGRPAAGEAFFRVAVASKLDEADSEWLRIDDTWRVRVSGAGVGPAASRTADGTTEVRRRIVWGPDDAAEFVEELSW